MFKKLLIGVVFVITYSCSNSNVHFVSNNYSYGSKVFNKNLELSTTFFGDMKFEKNSLINRKHINKILNDGIFLKDKIVIAYLKTIAAPDYETILLYSTKRDSQKDGLFKNDTINNSVCFKKSDENKSLYLYLKAINSKSNKTILADGNTIYNSITLDNSELEKSSYFDVFNSVKDLDNYFIATDQLKKAPIAQSNEQKFSQFQFLATINSFISNNKEYDSLIGKSQKRNKEIYQKRVDSLLVKQNDSKRNSGVEGMLDLVKEQKVVMLNENHWYPKHRVLALQLLKGLKEKGFNYLAIEAVFPEKDSILNLRGFPSKDTGYYTREPYFAHFIRYAKKMNFKIVEYDNMEGTIDRELAQAENIKAIIDNDVNAKIFVYVGIDHILESNPSKKRMAEYFKEISGVNPLTFNQIKIVSDTKNEIEIFPSSDFDGFNNLRNNVDYFVINNIVPSLRKVFPDAEFQNYTVRIQNFKKNKNEEILIKIYNDEEYKILKSNAIPVSIFYDKLVSKKLILELPKGNYFARVLSKNDDKLFGEYISIQ